MPLQQHVAGRPLYPLYSDQRNIDLKETKRGYISVVVATMLAKARRECDNIDDITAAAAKCKISDDPKPKKIEIKYKY